MNYTSIEQSKHLLEMGLKPKTADMHWFIKPNTEPYVYVGYDAEANEVYKNTNVEYLPCWSTRALLELIPYLISDVYEIKIRKYCIKENTYYQIAYGSYNGNIWKDMISTPECDTMLDACYFILVWLLENNYIKTE